MGLDMKTLRIILAAACLVGAQAEADTRFGFEELSSYFHEWSWAEKVEIVQNSKGKFRKQCRTDPFGVHSCASVAQARVGAVDVTLVETKDDLGAPLRQWCVEEPGLFRKRCEAEPQEVK